MQSFTSETALLLRQVRSRCRLLRPCNENGFTHYRPRKTLQRRFLQSGTAGHASRTPDLAFVFDIDGVLMRGRKPLDGAKRSLSYLKEQRIPFILLTNGGGQLESKRAQLLSEELGVHITPDMIIQSHTPFSGLEHLKKHPALIVGGHKGACADVAEKYGFQQVVTPSMIFNMDQNIWPFSQPLHTYHDFHRPGPAHRPQEQSSSDQSPEDSHRMRIGSIMVYNDPRDWGLDLAVIVDCLLSRQGYLGTTSSKNGDHRLPNKGYQQDQQPPLFFSNPDLWFAADWNLPRLGQGAFKAALEGVWAQITGGPSNGVGLQMTVTGKPSQSTYEYAESKLDSHRRTLTEDRSSQAPLRNIYMVGDNPESDIRGAMGYKSPMGTTWSAALVRSGVYAGGEPSVQPSTIADNVEAAVQWAVKHSGWENQ